MNNTISNAEFIRMRIERAFIDLAEMDSESDAMHEVEGLPLTLFMAQCYLLRAWAAYVETERQKEPFPQASKATTP